jgi:hypothetical protein
MGRIAGLRSTPSTRHASVPFHEIAEVIGRNLDVPAGSIPLEDVAGYFDYLAWTVALDNPTSSALTQKLLGWHTTHPGLIDDLNDGHYFPI